MDPTANLQEQRDLVAKDWTGKDTDELTPEEIAELHTDYCRLADLVQALDQWITRGGFLPAQWRSK